MKKDESKQIKFKNGSVISIMEASKNRARGKGFMYVPDEEEPKINVLAVAIIASSIVLSFWLGFGFHAWLF